MSCITRTRPSLPDGALQGHSKEAAVKKYGADMVKLWRNSYDTPPPPAEEEAFLLQANDPKYADVPRELLPNGECLRDTLERCLPFWRSVVEPQLRARRTVLVTAHGHSIRALVKAIDKISDTEIARISMPNGIPLLYEVHLACPALLVELCCPSSIVVQKTVNIIAYSAHLPLLIHMPLTTATDNVNSCCCTV